MHIPITCLLNKITSQPSLRHHVSISMFLRLSLFSRLQYIRRLYLATIFGSWIILELIFYMLCSDVFFSFSKHDKRCCNETLIILSNSLSCYFSEKSFCWKEFEMRLNENFRIFNRFWCKVCKLLFITQFYA